MNKKKVFDIAPKPLNAVIVGVASPNQGNKETLAHLEELQALAYTAGIKVVNQFVQKLTSLHQSTLIGLGKVEEIGAFVKGNNIDRVIFDDDLTPMQTRNLENAFGCEVWDRSLLILSIFAMHARTKQAKTQVELAQYQYLLPRLTGMWPHLSRQQGGIGMKGPGEKELEKDKRVIQRKMSLLRKELEHIETVNQTKRKRRKEKINVTLVGYTNAGKSTLMHCLSHEEVLVEDKLFATLSPTVRKVTINNLLFLLTDTVGFIRKLPHSLIEAFNATLSEVREADLLLHVVDFSHPEYECHIDVVHQTLREIGAVNVPQLLILNKQDQVKPELFPQDSVTKDKNVFFAATEELLERKYGMPAVCCSAMKEENMDRLRRALYRKVALKNEALLASRR